MSPLKITLHLTTIAITIKITAIAVEASTQKHIIIIALGTIIIIKEGNIITTLIMMIAAKLSRTIVM